MLAALLADLAERSGLHSRRHRALYDRVARAVDGQGLSVVLQPIIETRTGRLVGAEALARFAARDSGPSVSGPAAWFADAETVGLRRQLEETAARLALQRLPDLEDTATLTLNVSPDLVTDGGLDALLPEVDVSRVVVEITEHAAVPDYRQLHDALDAHRRAGLRLAVDDAGAGYASFRHILNLRPDLIKVDMSLVSRIDVDAAQQALVGSLLSFAESSGATLLAEGVETQGELDELARIGVPLVQGFLLARPTPPPLPPRYPTPTAIVLP
jgi:EAL domain-containing protein (putative c-di-GMP-specific phosphodiesterase class I)